MFCDLFNFNCIRLMRFLLQELRDFMDNARAGVVYFNFGSLLNVASLPKATVAILLNVLGRLEQKVIFKWSGNDTQTFPANFYVDSWLPQLEILSNIFYEIQHNCSRMRQFIIFRICIF